MGSINEVTLVGNLTREPELKQSEGKKPVCIIGLATNRNWTDESGKKHEEPEYHRIVAFDKLAETCHQMSMSTIICNSHNLISQTVSDQVGAAWD